MKKELIFTIFLWILSAMSEDEKYPLFLSWEQFDTAVDFLANQLRSKSFSCIYGEPRGGLVLAVCLSHKLDVPLSLTPQDQMLWCDDIVDTGATFQKVRLSFPESVFCTWVCKHPASEIISALNLEGRKEWILFPWEVSARIQEERQKYQARLGAKSQTPSLSLYSPESPHDLPKV